jgi:hypothetical protein
MLLVTVFIGVSVVWRRLSLLYRVAVLCSGYGVGLFVIFLSNTALATRCLDVFEIYALLLYVVFMQLLKGNKRLAYVAMLVVLGFGLYVKELSLVDRYTLVAPMQNMDVSVWTIARGGTNGLRAQY